MTENKPKLTCYTTLFSNWDFLKNTGVLSNERIEEIKCFCADDQYVPAKLEDGRVIQDWCVHKPTGKIFNKFAMESSEHYRNVEILSEILSVDEINSINERANDIISREQNRRKYEKATKVLEKDYAGPVYSEKISWYNEGYFESLTDFYDTVNAQKEETEENNETFIKPTYVWACKEKPSCYIHLSDVLENASQDAHEDFDTNDLQGLAELSAAIDKFNKLNEDNVTYYPDYSKVVILE